MKYLLCGLLMVAHGLWGPLATAAESTWQKEIAPLLDPDGNPVKGRLEKAEAIVQKAVDGNPKDMDALVQLARIQTSTDPLKALVNGTKAGDSGDPRGYAISFVAYVNLAPILQTKLESAFKRDEDKINAAVDIELDIFSAYKILPFLGLPPKPINKKDTDGKNIDLADYRGKVVLVDFWATWCVPCVEEMPNLLEIYEKHHKNGFDIIGISLDDDVDALGEFLTENKVSWRQYYDGKGEANDVFVAWGLSKVPAMYLIGPEGKVRAINLRGKALAKRVDEMIAKQKKPKKE